MSRWRRLVAVLVCIASCAVVGSAPARAGVPPTIGGLAVAPEDVTAVVKKHAGPKSYSASTRLWSLRSGTRLRGTLQVTRLVKDADPESREFQRLVIGQIGQAGARRRVVGGTSLYVTVSNEQALYVWFRPRHVLVLSVASDFATPRALLREALAVQP